MGLEATCACSWGDQTGTVKALLETTEIIVRGDFKRRIPLASLSGATALGDTLHLTLPDGSIRLALGPKRATEWARKIAAEPPTLRAKLGLANGAKAFLCGKVTDASLDHAIAGATTRDEAAASMAIAEIATQEDLAEAMALHAALPLAGPIWIVHGKGRAAIMGETAIRTAMRAAGYIDSKVSAVSSSRSATRYSRNA